MSACRFVPAQPFSPGSRVIRSGTTWGVIRPRLGTPGGGIWKVQVGSGNSRYEVRGAPDLARAFPPNGLHKFMARDTAVLPLVAAVAKRPPKVGRAPCWSHGARGPR